MKSYTAFKRQVLKDKEVKKAYDALGPEFEIISLLVKRRIEKGLSQEEFARCIGTKQSAISRFESGKYNPTLHFLHKVATGLDAEVRVIISPRQ